MKLMMAVAAFALAIESVHAQYTQYGAVENFYQANTDLDGSQYAGRPVNPSYWLVDWNRWHELDERLINNGFVRLGVSNWEDNNSYGGGIPQKELAIAYAQPIGASIVMYATHTATDKYNYSEHLIGFYAKQGAPVVRRAAPANRPTSAEASVAINRFQDAHGEPRLQGGVTYDAQSDTYNWIGPKTGRTMSKSAEWFLDHFGAYL
jgi:hypothetical protein